MTNQSYAQVTIACKTVESPILHVVGKTTEKSYTSGRNHKEPRIEP